MNKGKAIFSSRRRIAVAFSATLAVLALCAVFFFYGKDDKPEHYGQFLELALTKNALTTALNKPVRDVTVSYHLTKKHAACHCKVAALGEARAGETLLARFLVFIYPSQKKLNKYSGDVPPSFQRHRVESIADSANFVFAVDRDITLSFNETLHASYYRFLNSLGSQLDDQAAAP